MSAPEAFWTVIGIAVSLDRNSTLRARKIFNMSLKSFAHALVPVLLPWLIRSKVRFKLGEAPAARCKSQSF